MSAELIEAVRVGDVRTVQSLLGRAPALASSRDGDGTSAVLIACTSGHERVLAALLAAGPDLDVFSAAALGEVKQLEILLSIDPGLAAAVAADGTTALHLAARFGRDDAARRLLDAGADASATDGDGAAPADVAARHGHHDLAALLRRG